MTFELNPEHLAPYLKLLTGLVESNQVMQILAHIHLTIQDQVLTMTTSNTEMQASIALPVLTASESSMSLTVSARKLTEIMRWMESGSVMSWKYDGQWVHIQSGHVHYRLATLDAERFPFLADFKPDMSFEIEASLLKRLFDQTAFAIAKQDIRVYLNGLLLDWTAGELTFVASDGHRMCLRKTALDVAYPPIQMIIPRRTVMELSRLLAAVPDQEKVVFAFSSHMMSVSHGVWRMSSHLMDASYPPYRRILQKTARTEVTLPVQALRTALSRMSVCTSDRFRGVMLSLSPGKLMLKSSNFEHEEAEEWLDLDYQGEPDQWSLGLGYFLDVLNALDADFVTMLVSRQDQSVLLLPVNDPGAIYMIMLYSV